MNDIRRDFLRAPGGSAYAFGPAVSIELAPEQARGFAPRADCFAPGSRVFLTHLAGKPEALQIDAALRIKEMGYVPVPHLAARNFRTAQDYVDLVQAHSRNGIGEALFLGGNPALFPGPMAEAAQLLAHPVLSDSAIRTAFVAGYPEGHPAIVEAALADALRRKLEICADRSLEARVVSQFAFDGDMIGDWARNLHTLHSGLSVHVGLAGVTSLTKLIRFAMMCGVGPSLAALRRSASGLFNVIADRNPAEILETMAANYPAPLGPLHLHFFPFGGWEKTLAWLSDYRELSLSRVNER
ncbi:methylenetetrahydrofolate reductase [Mesorhizobium sp. M7A.F.Ca.US.011.01.1.1]|jgi:methylenetetrahydrofolate reductase (NADPH)|uniref:methylenetetrahydrofolate reductase n=1 Tax=Mesorhizobium sp. M7A.F.Ca.US.011.01.1.1 TaxID=2496741 RepID=UPI000FCC6CC3|nr:methylenetetrahydrofolate reductase [Mesorhizobium sp. M7A.F.Ca.US.011.01.1.1]RUX29694.1 methylenetetrahydrofolate reductase [Mesorhizobium sp. M7A.F.Ca.US.011.01.1.1]